MRSHLSRQPIRAASTTAADPSRAVVLGGSLAGLLTACVLAPHFDDVVVVDRDNLDRDLEGPRRGVPQARQTHGLLMSGANALERLLPGYTEAMIAAGAVPADVLGRSRWLMGGHVLRRVDSGMIGLLASRTLIEAQVRRRVAATPGVRLLGGHDIAGLLSDGRGGDVVGAVVVPRQASGDAPLPVHVRADLVVDATGRGSRAPAWLKEMGFTPPEEETVEARLCYVTRLFECRPGVLDDLDADIVGGTPDRPRSGVALRQEGGRWTVTIAGCLGEEPPSDLDGFLAYARSLPTSGVAEVIEGCRPVGGPEMYRYPASRWRHWERLERRPRGFVVIGDAVCSFNPVYGQGMSVAALHVEALKALLDGSPRDGRSLGDRLDRLHRNGPRAFADVATTAWGLATGADRRMPGQPAKPLPERLIDRYVDRLLALAPDDAELTIAFGRVLNLLAPPQSLLAPSMAWRVLGPRSWRSTRRQNGVDASGRDTRVSRPEASTRSRATRAAA